MKLIRVPLVVVTWASLNNLVHSFQQNGAIRYHATPLNTGAIAKTRPHGNNYSIDSLRAVGEGDTTDGGGGGGESKSVVVNGFDLKVELTAYLKKREEMGADEAAKGNVGKVIGGTKGNAILEYISGSPNKAYIVEAPPDPFDYDELTRYGFGYLVTPIMDSGVGGRRGLYALMDLPLPPVSDRIKPRTVSARKLVFDRTGEGDKGRYSGLKVTQIIDDEEMGRKLEEVRRKEMDGEALGTKLVEEEYQMPFADKRNVGPQQTPEWTPAMLDEEGRKAGRALAWAEAAKAGEFQSDPYERMNVEGPLRIYSVATALLTGLAFGKSTPAFLATVSGAEDAAAAAGGVLGVLQGLAFVLVLNAVLAGVLCGGVFAPGLNRNGFIWGVKGLAGGPLAIIQLKGLDVLRTRGDIAAQEKADRVS